MCLVDLIHRTSPERMSLVGVEEDKNSLAVCALPPACASAEFVGLQHKSLWLHLFAPV